jgi:hypothetical protein
MLCRQVPEIVPRCRYDENTDVVQGVHGLRPCLGRQTAHAHGDDMHLWALIAGQFVHVIECLRNGAILE